MSQYRELHEIGMPSSKEGGIFYLSFTIFRYVLGELHSPFIRRDIVERFENTDIGALVSKNKTVCDFRNRNIDIGKQRRGIATFAKMDIVRQRFLCVFFELAANIALVITDCFDNFGNTHCHVVFAVQVRKQMIEPFGIFGFLVNLMLQSSA